MGKSAQTGDSDEGMDASKLFCMDWELINPSDGPHPYYTIIVSKNIKKAQANATIAPPACAQQLTD
ncbi:MAG: hypothetical protein AB8I58_07740 [Anaerolineales bacterium]|jgi:hypothetical protein